MRLSTVILCDMVLQQNGIRAAGRLVVAPPSTVTAALSRLEKELSVALVRRGPAGMSLSVQAEQIRPQLHKLALLCRKVYRLDAEAPAEGALQNPVTF
ncbi:MAG: LysR family transcriptional regulator, partial [Rhodobacteraceae bacterium]|nr:LysR family transcriptional regulator [Paracoccaceae bacterium]